MKDAKLFKSPPPKLTPSVKPPDDVGKGGEHGQVTNAEFIATVIHSVPEGGSPGVCLKPGDPNDGGWFARKFETRMNLPSDQNCYLNCSTFRDVGDDGFKARKDQFVSFHFLLLDDLGTKVTMDKLSGFELSWRIETSPGNYQGGIILSEPIKDAETAERLQKALINAGLCDEGAAGVNRWARMPNAINGKDKYRVNGRPFQCRLVEWRPEKWYTFDEIVKRLNLVLSEQTSKQSRSVIVVSTEQSSENPVIVALKEHGLYKTALGDGKHDITCPWVDEHTDALNSGTAYFEPNDQYPVGGFKCMHSHGDRYKIRDLIDSLGLEMSQARNVPLINVEPGDLHGVVDAAERALVRRGKHFQAGGLIVSIVTDPTTKDPAIVPLNKQSLTIELSKAAYWQRYDRRVRDFVQCDPPQRHTGILFELGSYEYLPPLKGLARQPYYRESDGILVTKAGYDQISKMVGVFDPSQFVIPDPTLESARAALASLESLLSEFRFANDHDKSAALSAMLTATVRPSLPCAPAFHVRAPASGSGKSYLCELISCLAGPAGSAKVSFPKTSDEASKVLLSLLLANPAVIEFDDMDADWIPHGVINRALTSGHITERILGISKTATVNTRSLILGSGNNVGPVRDLLRRVVTINIDPRCSTPALIKYSGKPVEEVLRHRGKYVIDALTIIEAWKQSGSPRSDVDDIVSYGGAWADHCRHPLIWLGMPDPATTLLEQVSHDPDLENLGRLLTEWYKAFGSTAVPLRKVLAHHPHNINDEDTLDEAIREFPVVDREGINRSKLGWLLKKNEGRIVNSLKFQKGDSKERNTWMVVKVK